MNRDLVVFLDHNVMRALLSRAGFIKAFYHESTATSIEMMIKNEIDIDVTYHMPQEFTDVIGSIPYLCFESEEDIMIFNIKYL